MNDERPIEKLLRRYAKKRREDAGAPLELHPATRRLLQGEVTRQFGKTGAETASSPGWLALLRAKWIYATAAAGAVLLAAIWLGTNRPGPSGVELAKQDHAPTAAPEPRPGGGLLTDHDAPMPLAEPMPAKLEQGPGGSIAGAAEKEKAAAVYEEPARVAPPAVAEAEAIDRKPDRGLAAVPPEPVASAEGNEFSRRYGRAGGESSSSPGRLAASAPSVPPPATAPAPAPAARPVAVAAADRRDAAEVRRKATRSSTRTAPPTATKVETNAATFTPVTTDALALNETGSYALAMKQASAAAKAPILAQRFANVSPAEASDKSDRSPAAAPVLVNFQIEQAGDQLRVIDSDGSTYLGKVVAPVVIVAGAPLKGAESLKREAQAAFADSLAPTATGVRYEVLGTNRTLNQQVRFTWNYLAPTNAPVQALYRGAPAAPLPQLLNNSGVSGRAQISAGPEIEIRARPVGP